MLNEIRACKRCQQTLPLGAKPIVQMHPQAKILIASQAPGSVAHRLGVPFLDKSGERLRAWLGLNEDDFFNPQHIAILPMGFCYPGKGKGGDLPPLQACADIWRLPALSYLKNIQLTLLIGQYAQQWHLARANKLLHKTLTQRVKHWEAYWPQFLPLPHPSPRNNIWLSKNSWFEAQIVPVLQEKVARLLS